MRLYIRKTIPNYLGAEYTLVADGKDITFHFCSNDGFAYSDLFGHDETRKLIKDMPLSEFQKLPIIQSDQSADIGKYIKITFDDEAL